MAENIKRDGHSFKIHGKQAAGLLVFLVICLFTAGCGRGPSKEPKQTTQELSGQEQASSGHWHAETIRVDLPDYEDHCRIVYLADLHIIVPGDEQVEEAHRETVDLRAQAFSASAGIPALQLWNELVPQLDSYGADRILIGGDLTDYCSEANIEAVREGLEKLETPVLYVRADHDLANWYSAAFFDAEEAADMQASLGGSETVFSDPVNGLRILCWNNSTSQLPADAAGQIKEELDSAAAAEEPVLLLTHVPLESQVDRSLEDLSKEVWGDRALLWGTHSYYIPDENTARALEYLLEENSPLSFILSGHLHFEFSGPVTEKISEYVAPPAFEGQLRIFEFY